MSATSIAFPLPITKRVQADWDKFVGGEARAIGLGSLPDPYAGLTHAQWTAFAGVLADLHIQPLLLSRPYASSQALNWFSGHLLPRFAKVHQLTRLESEAGWMPVSVVGPLLVVAHFNPFCSEQFDIPEDLLIKCWVDKATYEQLRSNTLEQLQMVFRPREDERDFQPWDDWVKKELDGQALIDVDALEQIKLCMRWFLAFGGLESVEDGLLRTALGADEFDKQQLPVGFDLAASYLLHKHMVSLLTSDALPQDVMGVLAPTFLQRMRAIPTVKMGGALFVAVSDIHDWAFDDGVEGAFQDEILRVYKIASTPAAVLSVLERRLSTEHTAEVVNTEVSEVNLCFTLTADAMSQISPRDPNTQIDQIVQWVFWEGARHRASDIHVEEFKGSLSVRLAVDGSGFRLCTLPGFHLRPFMSIIRGYAGMKLDGKEHDEGRFSFMVSGRRIDVRVSQIFSREIYPKLTMRLLDKGLGIRRLSDLNLEPIYLDTLKRAYSSKQGLFVVSGPTGSGKSTTLYAILAELNVNSKFLYTIEDPVEFEIDGVCQVQASPEAKGEEPGSFADILKRLLRADPDVILVGETRDLVTAKTALRAALTGHLVLTTLHANSSIGVVQRLLDMGVDPLVLGDASLLFQAQRLVRNLCSCKIMFKKTREIDQMLELHQINGEGTDVFYRAGACDLCQHTGYRGRSVIMELLPVTPEIRECIIRKAPASHFLAAAREMREFSTLHQQGLKLAMKGVTSIEEVEATCRGLA
jgi:type II secretory ATPase GspE/PulE/Tfp pilus assembly ATPase PilB-like protein